MPIAVRRAALLVLCLLACSAVATFLGSRDHVGRAWADPAGAKPAKPDARQQRDPAGWGSDHVGQELPEFVDSGECLFCHRNDVGPTWVGNKHSQTIRDATPNNPAVKALAADPATQALAPAAQLVMGDSRANRFLKRSQQYGRLDLLSVLASATGRGGRFKLSETEKPHWDVDSFGKDCAGCHATAVDSESHVFTTVSIDCFACHGDGPLDHANDTKLMPLAKARHDSPAVVTSVCASCHIRFGKSKSSGLPYANNFVAGDNLFKDYEFDWSIVDDPQLNPGDRHVLDNIREVVVYGNEQMTCLSCHEVHPGTTLKHRDLPEQAYCAHCHEPGKPKKEHLHYEVHSQRCRY